MAFGFFWARCDGRQQNDHSHPSTFVCACVHLAELPGHLLELNKSNDGSQLAKMREQGLTMTKGTGAIAGGRAFRIRRRNPDDCLLSWGGAVSGTHKLSDTIRRFRAARSEPHMRQT